MPSLKLTAAYVDSVRVESRTDFYDEHTNGLGLRVSPSGTKTFFYRYRYKGKNRRYTIERYSKNVFGLSAARDKVDELRSYVKKGGDPVGDEKATKQQPETLSFKELTEIYESLHLPTLRESTREYHKWVMETKIMPSFKNMNADEITRQDVIRMLDKIAIEGDAKATANKARSRLHHVYEFAKSRGLVEGNPVAKTKPYEGGNNESEKYYETDEIKNIWQTIEQLNEPVQSYMKIIMLTGQRRTETHKMQWKDIQHVKDTDFEGWAWIIPKQYAKSNRDHVVPLSPLALDVIRQLKERAGENPFVFASGASDEIPIGLKTIKRAVKTIKDDSGVSDFRLHDTRRTVATWLAKLGTPAEVVSKVLNHKTGGGGSLVTRIYNRYEYRAERQIALNKWANELQRIVTGETETKIHKLREAR